MKPPVHSPSQHMRVFLAFDLPMKTKYQRYNYQIFLKKIKRNGFHQLQKSIYVRSCANSHHADKWSNIIKKIIPKEGDTIILRITEYQWSNMIHMINYDDIQPEKEMEQLVLF